MTTTALNSLARASSAYLRSAMHQPIRWHEWGEEAFAAAQRENKPMLLDIGAVWCHWCHVMDRESYDDPAIAEIVNQYFIAVKVDRDERPDIDGRYQAAVQAVSGQGGWPLTAFLTSDGKPFYGGTYFPPNDGYGRPSFRRVLLSIANAYKEKHGDVVEQANMVESTIAQSESFAGRSGRVSPAMITAILESAQKMFRSEGKARRRRRASQHGREHNRAVRVFCGPQRPGFPGDDYRDSGICTEDVRSPARRIWAGS